MNKCTITIAIVMLIVLLTAPAFAEDDPSFYVKKDTWQETMRASTESLLIEEKAQGGGDTGGFRIYNEDLFGNRVLFDSGNMRKGFAAKNIDLDVRGVDCLL